MLPHALSHLCGHSTNASSNGLGVLTNDNSKGPRCLQGIGLIHLWASRYLLPSPRQSMVFSSPEKVTVSADRPSPRSFRFPEGAHLLITTSKAIYSWSASGLVTAFRSGSGGIVAAKQAGDGSNTLAVVDSEVVVLHDAERGMDRSYRLRGTEVRTSMV